MEQDLGLQHLHKRPVCSLKIKTIRGSFFFMTQQPLEGYSLFIIRLHDHTRLDSSGRVTSCAQRPLPDSTAHLQDTDVHAPGRIRTPNPSKRATADRRLTPCVYCVRQVEVQLHSFFSTLRGGEWSAARPGALPQVKEL
jgi:hypothetical protein